MRLMPAAFVPLWATGFIGAKYGLPYAEPFTFLVLRYLAVLAIAVVAIGMLRPPKLKWRDALTSTVIGVLIHGGYLGAVFWSISVGMPAGIAAVIVGLQPILTALLAGLFLKETVTLRQWAGLAIGLIGVCAVLYPKLELSLDQAASSGIRPDTIAATVAGLVSITLGTVLQRARSQGTPLWSGALWQYLGALIFTLPLAMLLETNEVEWSGEFIFALGWLVLVLSIGAISLLVLMLRHGAASKVATLFYLVPPVAALIAYLLFGETLQAVQMGGMALAAFGVWLATRRTLRKKKTAPDAPVAP